MSYVAYVALFFSEATREKLLKEITPVHPNLYADHITLAYKPSKEYLEEIQRWKGKEIPFTVIEEYCDADCQTVKVTIGAKVPKVLEAPSHITISTTETVTPKYSHELLNKCFGIYLTVFRLTGIVDSYPRGRL